MALSPMMSHYLTVKEQYKDCIVFYRLGDFYEMFFDDAVKASEILGLTLTGRDCGLKDRAPMCGVPFHAADLYISKLVAAGEKVAICEQMSEPNGRELVERKILRVVSAGTVTNDELIDAKTNNFLLALFVQGKKAAIAWTDITTGEFFAKRFLSGDVFAELFNELVRISPAEIISNREAEESLSGAPLFVQGVLPKLNAFTESEFERGIAINTLKNQLSVKDLKIFGFIDEDIAVIPCGALISYLKETQKSVLYNLKTVKILEDKEFLMMDSNAIRNLELVKTLRDGKRYGSLLWVLDKTKTSMGARMLSSWILSPLADIDKINYRLNGVESFYNNTLIRQSLADILSSVKDVGRLAGKISNGNLNPKDCVALSKSLAVIPNIKFQLSGIVDEYVSDIISKLSDYSDVVALLERAIADEDPEDDAKNKKNKVIKYIKEGYSKELDELRSLAGGGRNALSEIESKERERTGIKNLKIAYNRVFGYYIEVTNSFKDKVPYDYIRKQTLTGAERYITEELKNLEEKILSAVEQAEVLELKLFGEIKAGLTGKVLELQSTAEAIAELDVLISLAFIAREKGFVKPKIAGYGEEMIIKDGRHPVVEAALKQRFIPNDCLLDNAENRTMIITGPNMAGKSTYMRQIAIITIMAHIGSFVPAKEATIPLVDKIFTRIGASDSLISDQSTFMVEMTEVANIVRNATENSLLILDEVGRGTSTYDGLSIAWAALEYLTEKVRAKTLFATHYHELTELEGVIDGVKNYKVTVKELPSGVIFLRKIARGGANKSFGIEVATLAGVGEEITDRAKEILRKLESKDVAPRHEREEEKPKLSETERIIKDIDLNNLSPMQAFNIVSDLNEKLRGKDE